MDITEFLEYIDEIIDYDKIQKEYDMKYSEIKEKIDSLKPSNDLFTKLRSVSKEIRECLILMEKQERYDLLDIDADGIADWFDKIAAELEKEE